MASPLSAPTLEGPPVLARDGCNRSATGVQLRQGTKCRVDATLRAPVARAALRPDAASTDDGRWGDRGAVRPAHGATKRVRLLAHAGSDNRLVRASPVVAGQVGHL